MRVDLLESVAAELDAYAAAGRREWGEEVCGLVFGRIAWPVVRFDRFRPLPNAAPFHARGYSFAVDSGEHLRTYAAELEARQGIFAGLASATFHSHVSARAEPSPGDRELLCMLAFHFIAGADGLAFWTCYSGEWERQPIALVDG